MTPIYRNYLHELLQIGVYCIVGNACEVQIFTIEHKLKYLL